jgi:hypothetical protein
VHRVSGLVLVIGAVSFVVYVVIRSLLTSGVDPTVSASHALWIPVNGLGFLGAMMVFIGLPAIYARVFAATGLASLIGVVLTAVAWAFFGVFLTLYAALLLPWLAEEAPHLVAVGAPLPAALMIAIATSLAAWLVGGVLLALPFIRGRLKPTWIGYVFLAAALWMLVGNLVIAPAGPSANVAANLVSNLGPVLLLIALTNLGCRLWMQRPGSEIGAVDELTDEQAE